MSDDLKFIEFKDFSGGWNCVDNSWLLAKDETAILEDWDITTLPVSVRPKFQKLVEGGEAFRVLGIHSITWGGQHRIVTAIEKMIDNKPANWCLINVYKYDESYTSCPLFWVKTLIASPSNWSALPTYATVYRDTFYISNGMNMAGWLLKDIFNDSLYDVPKVDYVDGYIGKYPASFDQRLWVANTPYAPNLVLCTKIRRYPNIPFAWYFKQVKGDNEGWDEYGHEIWVGDDTELTGLTPAFGNQYAWKKDSVHLIERTEIGYSCKQLLSGYGVIDQRNIILAYNHFIFLDPSGKVYMWNGTEDIPRWISRDIDTFFKPIFGSGEDSVYLKQGALINKYNWSTKTAWEKDWEVQEDLIINDAGYIVQPKLVSLGYARIKNGQGIYFNPDTEKVGSVVMQFEIPFNDDPESEGYFIPTNYRVEIWYAWNNDPNTRPPGNPPHEPGNWTFGYWAGYESQTFGASFNPSNRPPGNNYLWLYMDFEKHDANEEIRVYGITINYSKDEFKGVGTQANPYRSMKYCMPNAFFHNNAYYLSVADDFTPQNAYTSGGYYYGLCSCNKLLMFTLPPNKEKGGWAVWKNKDICCAEHTFSIQGNRLLILGRAYPYYTGAHFATFPAKTESWEWGKPIQKLTTTSTDCGLPDNDKNFRTLSFSFVDKGVGKFKIKHTVTQLNTTTNVWVEKTGETIFNTTGNGLTCSKILDLTSPESASWNYGRRIQIELEAIDNGNGFYGQIDLLSIKIYFSSETIQPEQGEIT